MRKAFYLGTAVASGLALLFIVFQFFPFRELLHIIYNIDTRILFFYALVSFVIFALHVARWKIICSQHGIKLSFWTLFSYKTVGFAVSFITPGPKVGGEPIRTALLKKSGVSLPKALSATISDKTIELTSFGLMFVFVLTAALLSVSLPLLIRAVVLVSMLVILAVIGFGYNQMLRGRDPVLRIFKFLRLHKIKKLRKYEKELAEFEKLTAGFYGSSKKLFWLAQVLSAAAWLAAMLEYKVLLMMLGFSGSFVQVFLVYSAVGLAYSFPIPLALGMLEAIQASLFAAIGFSPAAGAALAIITRSRDLTWTLIGFMMLSFYGADGLRSNDHG